MVAETNNNMNLIFNEKRDLTNAEYINLCNKINKGALPAEYYRKALFNATTRESCELTRHKIIFDDGKLKIKVNRSLHQRHRDLLSIIFTDNKGISKPSADGGYLIYSNLYTLSKKMGYCDPLSGIGTVQKMLHNLRHTDMIIEVQNYKHHHMLLGDFILDEETGNYAIQIPPMTAKFHILNVAVEIPKEINQKIVAIPNSLAKIKALVSYMLSNQALKNGISFQSVCDKLDLNIASRKSEFLKEIKQNFTLLKDFNITFDPDRQIFKYEQIEAIKFHSPVKMEKIIECLDQQAQQPKEEPKKEESKKSSFESLTLFSSEEELKEILNTNEERYKKLITSFINSPITINNIEYIFTGLAKNSDNQILLEMKDKEERTLRANTKLTTYYSVFGSFFKELV